jgi:hypothetical protein
MSEKSPFPVAVDRDDRLARAEVLGGGVVDGTGLAVTVRVLRCFGDLGVGLEPVAQVMEQLADLLLCPPVYPCARIRIGWKVATTRSSCACSAIDSRVCP